MAIDVSPLNSIKIKYGHFDHLNQTKQSVEEEATKSPIRKNIDTQMYTLN